MLLHLARELLVDGDGLEGESGEREAAQTHTLSIQVFEDGAGCGAVEGLRLLLEQVSVLEEAEGGLLEIGEGAAARHEQVLDSLE